ncbi:hypothetical protein RFI_09369 [Reticulomyxa filosa]|uniref:Uncharacterized protein n=1 Tax=Reticulomyxa filosa TaxID=46433 RepID=X6NNA4_RETFI|nr:hypothetical protein RFI_09369 [Reticulomyxa filosa]|eukprot:ETO27765.1 hypothetical protein RFI_09369 [Reticulomyxa filosa]
MFANIYFLVFIFWTVANGDTRVCVTGTNGLVANGESLVLSNANAIESCGYTWYYLDNSYYGVTNYLEKCGSNDGASWNIFGVGLVDEGNSYENNLVFDLGGNNGWILLIFAGINSETTSPQSSWIDSLNYIYTYTTLNPVIRLNPPWNQAYYRDESDDADHYNYTTLAAAFKAVVEKLPFKPSQNIYFQIDNEPDLCSEWYPKKKKKNVDDVHVNVPELYTYQKKKKK